MKIICHRAQIFVTVQLKDFFNTSQCCAVLCGGGLCPLCVSGGAFMFHFNGLSLHCGHYLLDHLIAWFNSCCSVWGTSFIYCCHTSTSGNSAAGWPSHLWVVGFFGGVGSPATTFLSDVVYTESERKMGEKTQLAHWGAIKFQSPG